LKMVMDMKIGARYDCDTSLLKHFICKETMDILVSNSNLRSDEHFKSHLLGNGLYHTASNPERRNLSLASDI